MEPVVQVGPGFITFGTQHTRDLRIVDPRASFTLEEVVTWSAYMSEPVNSAKVTIRVFKVDPTAEGGQRLISESGVRPIVSGAQRFLRRVKPAEVLDGPGVYVVRYMRDETVLSEGSFRVD